MLPPASAGSLKEIKDLLRNSIDDEGGRKGISKSGSESQAGRTRSGRCLEIWRPVRESNPCRRREEKGPMVIQRNLAAWIALYRTSRTHGNAYWTFNGRATPCNARRCFPLRATDFKNVGAGT
jgi:hypothetical protein